MKQSIVILSLLCVLFVGCKKENGGNTEKEDLSYLLTTYTCEELNGHRTETRTTYDGYKEMSYKEYYDGQLTFERKNYSYDGLKASWDSYQYQNGDVNDIRVHCHYECEFLDNTYQREKYMKSEYYREDLQYEYTIYWEYDGKKIVSYRRFKDGVLEFDNKDFNYDGLFCTYKMTYYSSEGVPVYESSASIDYLDDTYLRKKSNTYTKVTFDLDGTPATTTVINTINEYDGKKLVESREYRNGMISSTTRDYQYNGLTCRYYYDGYSYGELNSTRTCEVQYLE